MNIILIYGKNCTGKSQFLKQFHKSVANGPNGYEPALRFTASDIAERDIFELIQVVADQFSQGRGSLFLEHPSRHAALFHKIALYRFKTVALETHSELIALRAIKLVRTGVLHPSELQFVVCRRDLPITIVNVNADGRFDRPWPEGFFPERRAEELESKQRERENERMSETNQLLGWLIIRVGSNEKNQPNQERKILGVLCAASVEEAKWLSDEYWPFEPGQICDAKRLCEMTIDEYNELKESKKVEGWLEKKKQ